MSNTLQVEMHDGFSKLSQVFRDFSREAYGNMHELMGNAFNQLADATDSIAVRADTMEDLAILQGKSLYAKTINAQRYAEYREAIDFSYRLPDVGHEHTHWNMSDYTEQTKVELALNKPILVLGSECSFESDVIESPLVSPNGGSAPRPIFSTKLIVHDHFFRFQNNTLESGDLFRGRLEFQINYLPEARRLGGWGIHHAESGAVQAFENKGIGFLFPPKKTRYGVDLGLLADRVDQRLNASQHRLEMGLLQTEGSSIVDDDREGFRQDHLNLVGTRNPDDTWQLYLKEYVYRSHFLDPRVTTHALSTYVAQWPLWVQVLVAKALKVPYVLQPNNLQA